VLAGPPGAGKSTVLRTEVLGADQAAWLTIDADEFKRALLREAIADGSYDAFIKPAQVKQREAAGERFFPLELASLVHEESSMLAKRLQREAIAEGTNVVIDTVLSKPDQAVSLGERFAAAGYTVEVVDVEVPFELSAARIEKRWHESYEEALETGDGLGGRWVPSEYAREVFFGTSAWTETGSRAPAGSWPGTAWTGQNDARTWLAHYRPRYSIGSSRWVGWYVAAVTAASSSQPSGSKA